MSLTSKSYHQAYRQAPPIRLLRRVQVVLILVLFCSTGDDRARGEELRQSVPWTWSHMVSSGPDGSRHFHGKPVDPALRNHWPEELEREFQARADRILAAQASVKAPVNTYFENEKRSYGMLMSHIVSRNDQQALKDIQAEDHQHDVWHRETAGIDGVVHDWLEHQRHLYRTSVQEAPLLQSRWQIGELQLTTANCKFTSRVDRDGHATFQSE